ncbi:MAG: glycosyltransferase family 39 protein [Solirubrobacteraceae bacterium]
MRGLLERLRGLSEPQRVTLGLLGLLVVSFLLRSTALHGRFWIDEGLSVGIASFPLTDIPGALRQDGSPPLYYGLLHVWINLVGDGEARTHALSLGFALLTVPVGFGFARALFSERAAWLTAIVAALIPFLSYYAQETRMYALAALLSMLAAGSFALVFLQGRKRWMPAFVLSGAALMYTHNWGLFMMAGLGLALLPLLRAGRVAWRDALIGFGAIGLLYLPWLPTVIYQAGHTGAPWSTVPSLTEVPGELAGLFGGAGAAVALLLVGGSGLAAHLALRRTRDASGTQQAGTVVTLGVALLIALVLAIVANQISPAWAARYFAALIGPIILLVGAVLSRAGNLGLATVAVLALLWLQPPTEKLNNKSNMHRVAVLLEDRVAPGDIVVSTHPEQVPVAAFYFPDGLRWASGMGWFEDTRIFDWRDALERYREARPRPTANGFIEALGPGQQLVLMQPILRTATWTAPWTKLVRRRSVQWERLLDRDPRLRRTAAIPHIGDTDLPRGVRIVLYSRTR